MVTRGMNNQEKINSAVLKEKGFYVFFSPSRNGGMYWATHVKLICQYCIVTKSNMALSDLEEATKSNQISLF